MCFVNRLASPSPHAVFAGCSTSSRFTNFKLWYFFHENNIFWFYESVQFKCVLQTDWQIGKSTYCFCWMQPWTSKSSGRQTQRANWNYILEKLTFFESDFSKNKSVGLSEILDTKKIMQFVWSCGNTNLL